MLDSVTELKRGALLVGDGGTLSVSRSVLMRCGRSLPLPLDTCYSEMWISPSTRFFFPFLSDWFVVVGRECTVLSYLNLVCFLWSLTRNPRDSLCSFSRCPCKAVEATSPSPIFLSHFVNPTITEQLLKKITYKHRVG